MLLFKGSTMATSYASSFSTDSKAHHGARSDVSRAPQSPSTASAPHENNHRHGSIYPTSTTKRSRVDVSQVNHKTPVSSIDYCSTSVKDSSSFRYTDTARPSLGNATYQLSGGLHRPTEETTGRPYHLNINAHPYFRRRWTNTTVTRSDGSQSVSVTDLERKRKGSRRIRSTPEMPQETWRRFVFNVVGEIAGKMWEFCRTSAFRGFTAGGGLGYAMTTAGPRTLDRTSSWALVDENKSKIAPVSIPVPGRFPEDDGLPELQESPPRPAKRLQTSQASGWVMVDHADSVSTSHCTSSIQTPNLTRSLLPRPVTPRIIAARRSRPSTARLTSVSHAESPYRDHARSASFASPRSTGQASQPKQSPSSADIQRYTSRIYREEKENEASMRKLNQQLKAMIRQGREALATKVEIQDDAHDFTQDDIEEDEGFAEGDYDMGGKPW